jgi:hypothetical protein
MTSYALPQVRQAGTAQLIFPDASPIASLTYSVDGVTVLKSIRRLAAVEPKGAD